MTLNHMFVLGMSYSHLGYRMHVGPLRSTLNFTSMSSLEGTCGVQPLK